MPQGISMAPKFRVKALCNAFCFRDKQMKGFEMPGSGAGEEVQPVVKPSSAFCSVSVQIRGSVSPFMTVYRDLAISKNPGSRDGNI